METLSKHRPALRAAIGHADRERAAFAAAAGRDLGVPTFDEVHCIYVPETCGRQPVEFPDPWVPEPVIGTGLGPCENSLRLNGPRLASCDYIPSTFGSGGWVSLPLDTASYNRRLSDIPGDPGNPLSELDLRRPIPLMGSGCLVQRRGGKLRMLLGSEPHFKMVANRRYPLFGGARRANLPHAGFIVFRLGDVFRRMAQKAACQSVTDDFGFLRELNCRGFQLRTVSPGLDNMREYGLEIEAGSRLELTFEVSVFGGRLASGDGPRDRFDIQQGLGHDQINLMPDVPLDGVLTGLMQAVPEAPSGFESPSDPVLTNTYHASVFGVGSGDGRAYAGKQRPLLSDGGAPGFAFKGYLQSAPDQITSDSLQFPGQWAYEPTVDFVPYFLTKSRLEVLSAAEAADILNFDQNFFEPERLFSEILGARGCKRVRFDITIFSPLGPSEVFESRPPTPGSTGISTCSFGDERRFFPYRVSTSLGWETPSGFVTRDHVFSRDMHSHVLSPRIPLGEITGVACGSPGRLGILLGAIMQDEPAHQVIGLEVDCTAARLVRR